MIEFFKSLQVLLVDENFKTKLRRRTMVAGSGAVIGAPDERLQALRNADNGEE